MQDQLEVANATIIQLNASMKSMDTSPNAPISELRKTIENLERLLKERDENLFRANSQMRCLKSTFLPKRSEKQAAADYQKPIESRTEVEIFSMR